MAKHRELYDILEVEATCTQSDIKKAYHRLAKKYHPDKNPDASHELFQKIQGAYEVLIDAEQREIYDARGLNGLAGNAGWDDEDGGHFGGMHDMDDFFAHIFGGAPPRGASGSGSKSKTAGKKSRGGDQIIPYDVTLEDAYTGKESQIELEKQVICTTCKGTGCKSKTKPRKCTYCKGQGTVMVDRAMGPMIMRREEECPDCEGLGETIRPQDACKKCKGKRKVGQKSSVSVYLERGARNGDRIVLRGESDQAPNQTPGDVILDISILPHDTFRLVNGAKSCDLRTTVTLPLSEALLGFDRLLLIHLDGRGLLVSQPAPGEAGHRVFQTGDVLKIANEGFTKRKSDTKGDLIVDIVVEMPTEREMAELSSKHLRHLQQALPPKRPAVPHPALTDEVRLVASTGHNNRGRQRNASYVDEDDEEDDEDGSDEGGDYDESSSGHPQCHQQ